MTMQATIYYVQLTNAQRDELNAHPASWVCPIGVAYLEARDGLIHSGNFDLLHRAATITVLDEDKMDQRDNEEIWLLLQNVQRPWADRPNVECHTDFPRSMDVGDIIVWEDGQRYRCLGTGFGRIEK